MKENREVVVEAFDVAGSFNLVLLRSQIDGRGSVLGRNPLILGFAEERYMAVFDYGSVVFFNFSIEEARVWLKELKELSFSLNRKEFTDSFALYIGENGQEQATTEQLLVKELTRDVVKLVAIVLSRSVALEYYEDMIEDKMDHLEGPISLLANKGRLYWSSGKFTKKFGSVLSINLELVHSLHLLDEPDIAWESAEMQRIYRQLNEVFDLDNRSRAVGQKLKVIKESCQFILGLQHFRTDSVLELAIIILFIIDIILLFFPFKL
ncbi:MAG: RMD1 family protein [Patescibacteria group bacterium]|nr:RMD1 family protein [Patescibacteria group bacterium]